MSKSYSQDADNQSEEEMLEEAETLRKWIVALLPHTSNEVLGEVEFTNTGNIRVATFEQTDGEYCNVYWNGNGYEVFSLEDDGMEFDEMNPVVDYIDDNLLED